MKAKIFILNLFLVISIFTAGAAVKNAKLKVEGNCNMCKMRIEKAAKSVEGVRNAIWDPKTKVLVVEFDDEKTTETTIQKTIAKAGHDTGKMKASDEIYGKLPGCCQYRK